MFVNIFVHGKLVNALVLILIVVSSVEKLYEWIDPNLMDSHQQRKHMRITAIAKVIERKGRVDYKRFVAKMEYHGLRRKVAIGYLDAMRDLGLIKFDGDCVVWNREPNTEKHVVVRSDVK